MRNNILITAVFHQKSAGNNPKRRKPKLLVEMARGIIGFHNSIELQMRNPYFFAAAIQSVTSFSPI